VLAADRFDLTLTSPSTKGIDAIAPDGRSMEITATGGDRGVALPLGLGLTAANGASGTMLGSPSNFHVTSFSDGFASLTGTINGNYISRNIRKIGNNISIS
jgi:hypothetical protein